MNKARYILATEKKWHDPLFERLKSYKLGQWIRVRNMEELVEALKSHKPQQVFFPHWSHIIPSTIIEQFQCVIFHMTDLPYGRGGSPLQNLIVQGKKETMISAILADEGVDTGDIYLKKALSLNGSAQEIFERSAIVIEEMIREIIQKNITPHPQEGTPTVFKRRTPEMSNIGSLTEIEQVYDYIRMLDADGYPHAYIETKSFKLELRNAEITKGEIIADVRIIKK